MKKHLLLASVLLATSLASAPAQARGITEFRETTEDGLRLLFMWLADSSAPLEMQAVNALDARRAQLVERMMQSQIKTGYVDLFVEGSRLKRFEIARLPMDVGFPGLVKPVRSDLHIALEEGWGRPKLYIRTTFEDLKSLPKGYALDLNEYGATQGAVNGALSKIQETDAYFIPNVKVSTYATSKGVEHSVEVDLHGQDAGRIGRLLVEIYDRLVARP